MGFAIDVWEFIMIFPQILYIWGTIFQGYNQLQLPFWSDILLSRCMAPANVLILSNHPMIGSRFASGMSMGS